MQENLAPRRTYGRDSVEFCANADLHRRAVRDRDDPAGVVDLAVPTSPMAAVCTSSPEALNDDSAKFISFFISFAVIGRYRVAHHTYFSGLARMDRG